MRCLGRLASTIVLLLLLAGAWLYRGELIRWGRDIVDPMSAVRRTGTPSEESLVRAHRKVALLPAAGTRDSVVLSADELASLAVEGSALLAADALDSLSVELGDRTIRVRALLDVDRLPANLSRVIPGSLSGREELLIEGPLTPTRPGEAEWVFERVMVRGLPIPADLVARVLGEVAGSGSDGSVRIVLPPGIHGFRVRPEGVALYRGGS